MIRKTILVSAAALVPVVAISVGLAGAQIPVHNVAPNVVGAGNPVCAGAWSGTYTFNPPLTNGGAATTETIKFKGKAKPCAGGVPVPVKGKVVAVLVVNGAGANNCLNIFPPLNSTVNFPIPFVANVAWAPTNIAPTMVNFPSITVTSPPLGGMPINVSYMNGVVAGAGNSYPTAAASVSIYTVKPWNTIMAGAGNNCPNGLGNLAVSAAGTTGTF